VSSKSGSTKNVSLQISFAFSIMVSSLVRLRLSNMPNIMLNRAFARVLRQLSIPHYSWEDHHPCVAMSEFPQIRCVTISRLQVVWCWILGACMCFTLGASIAEIVSAYPTCGGLYVILLHSWLVNSEEAEPNSLSLSHRYTASAQLCPKRHRARVGSFSPPAPDVKIGALR
jgi:hypothetical protein